MPPQSRFDISATDYCCKKLEITIAYDDNYCCLFSRRYTTSHHFILATYFENVNQKEQMHQAILSTRNNLSTAVSAGNSVVSVDGGVEREVSQMRQMVLQVAVTRGYKGIGDLHKNTKLKTKQIVIELITQNVTKLKNSNSETKTQKFNSRQNSTSDKTLKCILVRAT